jgi:hypothetical protein
MDPRSAPYVLLGVAAEAAQRSRAPVSAGVRVAAVATLPAVAAWRSRACAQLRTRAEHATSRWGDAGIGITEDALEQARSLVADIARTLADEWVRSGLADELLDRLLSSGAFDRIVTVVINHPATEALVGDVLDDPALDRLIARVMDSRLIDEVTARALESEQFRLVIEHITRSPEVRAALRRQTVGLADDVAVGVRSRTVLADDAAERFARGLLKRRRPQATE